MTDYVATTPGLFPLPDWAKSSLSTLKGHQRHDLVDGDEGEDVLAEYASARAEVVDRQVDAGLDRVVEGQLRWDDMLAHPLAVNDAVETHGLVRYYDNNNFFRDPVVVDELVPSGDVAGELSAATELTDRPLQAVLPGPYTLADLATDEHYGDPAELLAAVASLLAAEVERFPAAETLFLLEPSVVARPPGDDERSAVGDAIDAVAGAFPGEVVVHPYWGAPDEATYGTLLAADVDAVGYDLVTAPGACADLVGELGTLDGAALGVVDGQNTRVESPEAVRERVAWFESQLSDGGGLDVAYVTANTELFYLPVPTFEAKLAALGSALTPEVSA